MRARTIQVSVALGLALLCACGEKPKSSEAVAEAPAGGAPAAMPPINGASVNLRKLNGAPQFNVERLGKIVSPLAIKGVSVPSQEPLEILGWAVSPATRSPGSAVDVVIDGCAYATNHSIARADVVAALKDPAYLNSGFAISFAAGEFPTGIHHLTVRVVSPDGKSYLESPVYDFSIQ